MSNKKTTKSRMSKAAVVRQQRKRVLMWLYVAFGVEIVAALLTSPRLAIKTHQVQGAEGLPAEEIQQTLEKASVPNGVNWFRAPLSQIERSLKPLPWIKSVKVTRHFPNRIETKVTLREPVIVAVVGKTRYEADAAGTPIRSVRTGRNPRLPVVQLIRQRPVELGVPLEDNALEAAIRAFEDMQEQPTIQVAKIEVDPRDNLCLNMNDGLRVRLGQATEMDTKLELVRRIFRQEPTVAQRLATINLSCPSAPACVLREASGVQKANVEIQ